MTKLKIQLEKFMLIPIYGIFILSLFGGLRGCNSTKENTKLRKEIVELSLQIDSLRSQTYTKEQADIRFSIEGYEISKRMLYDQNAIIRTVVRPDDRMNQYDTKISELRKKLK
jgi:hypothetical protein